MMSSQRDFNIAFIQEYKKHECLWNIRLRNNDYYKNEKDKAYNTLEDFVRENIDPKANRGTVIKKIKYFTETFFNEFNKMREARRDNHYYQTNFDYYDVLMFLEGHQAPNPRKVNGAKGYNLQITDTSSSSHQMYVPMDASFKRSSEQEHERDNYPQKKKCSGPAKADNFRLASSYRDERPSHISYASKINDSQKRKDLIQLPLRSFSSDLSTQQKNELEQSQSLEKGYKSQIEETESAEGQNSIDEFGEHVVKSLKRMNVDQQLKAITLFTKVLIKGEEGSLTFLSQVVDPK